MIMISGRLWVILDGVGKGCFPTLSRYDVFVTANTRCLTSSKSETYTPVYSEDIAHEYSINYNPAVHGTSGPVQVSYPKYFYPQSGRFGCGLVIGL